MKGTFNFSVYRFLKTNLFFLLSVFFLTAYSQNEKPAQFSTAGFYQTENSPREVFSMNPAWRFFKGDAENAQLYDLNDSLWQVVTLPHGIEILPDEASGNINYQGIVWYRKHFELDEKFSAKKLFLHFEAIMGKSEIWLNGHLLKNNYGGYLPIVIDITDYIYTDKANILAVKADNSDDPSYPPGKPQDMLDFAYFGGIYRDCWLISHPFVYITDPNYADKEASGGLFVSFGKVNDELAEVFLNLHLINDQEKNFNGTAFFELRTPLGNMVAKTSQKLRIAGDSDQKVSSVINLKNPGLWSPEKPNLYHLFVEIKSNKGEIVDGFMQRIGIRSIEFKGRDGFWLNGNPYNQPLIGANRHQEFALVGNAVPNSVHWRDAKKLRDAGLKVIRNAHYPQDPAFMDACDELGLFVIVNTPGWQFWNEEPVFEERIYQNIRDMVRRDRNHPSVLMWEPVLNETWYPEDFAGNTIDMVFKEYPFNYCYTVCDAEARGSEMFPVLYAHPKEGDADRALEHTDPSKTYFTREWGDNVDDWNSHNSPSRVHRSWGESAMLTQAGHYAKPPYTYTSLNTLYAAGRQHFGGCLWHPFDHNRGYHPDPFYGGIMDAFRQPKTSYQMFRSQQKPEESEPMVFIAHEMSPFSLADVQVYSNCEAVRLTIGATGQVVEKQKVITGSGLPYPPYIFRDVYHFMDDKVLAMSNQHNKVYLLAEGFIDGKVVATHKVMPARRPSKLLLWADDENLPLEAGGSDFVTVIAAVADDSGNIKRLNNEEIAFVVEGEGSLVGSGQPGIHPVKVSWGTAPALIRSGLTPGTIKVRASTTTSGTHKPLSAELEITSKRPEIPLIYLKSDTEAENQKKKPTEASVKKEEREMQRQMELLQQEINRLKLKEVERQQKEFGENPKL